YSLNHAAPSSFSSNIVIEFGEHGYHAFHSSSDWRVVDGLCDRTQFRSRLSELCPYHHMVVLIAREAIKFEHYEIIDFVLLARAKSNGFYELGSIRCFCRFTFIDVNAQHVYVMT